MGKTKTKDIKRKIYKWKITFADGGTEIVQAHNLDIFSDTIELQMNMDDTWITTLAVSGDNWHRVELIE